MSKVSDKLKGGDRRSIGRADEVVGEVLDEPELFAEVFEGMLCDDDVVRMRAADVVEKVTAERPEYLDPFKSRLINEVANIDQQEVRWHVAQMLPRVKLSKKQRDKAVEILLNYIETDKSKIVKTFSIQALADFAEQDPKLRPQVVKLIMRLMKTGSPALISRGQKLLNSLR